MFCLPLFQKTNLFEEAPYSTFSSCIRVSCALVYFLNISLLFDNLKWENKIQNIKELCELVMWESKNSVTWHQYHLNKAIFVHDKWVISKLLIAS